MRELSAFGCGLLFALGLGISGMTDPSKVLAFLELRDPALLIVMAGAVSLNLVAYPLVRRLRGPLLDQSFHVPERRDVTIRLVLGAILFGAGWGIAGYCPGPALVAVVSLGLKPVAFVLAMIVGMVLARQLFT